MGGKEKKKNKGKEKRERMRNIVRMKHYRGFLGLWL